MSDILVLGGESEVYQPEAQRAYSGSADTGQFVEILTDTLFPLGEGGDGVYRRCYVPIEYDDGISITALPIIDGKDRTEYQRTVTRSGSGSEEFMVAMNKRGSSFAMKLTIAEPTGRVAIHNRVQVAIKPGVRAKVDKTVS